jgi:hypothetical protein
VSSEALNSLILLPLDEPIAKKVISGRKCERPQGARPSASYSTDSGGTVKLFFQICHSKGTRLIHEPLVKSTKILWKKHGDDKETIQVVVEFDERTLIDEHKGRRRCVLRNQRRREEEEFGKCELGGVEHVE